MTQYITITKESQGERLDKFLVTQFPDLSRSQIQKSIESGAVVANGEKIPVHYFLKSNDQITINSLVKNITKNTAPNQPNVNNESGDLQLFKEIKIIDEQNDFLIVEKPAGLLVHPTEKNETNTLVDWLVAKYPNLKKIGENPARAAIVHRLDKEVSGLMIIPKNQDAFDYFKNQFKKHTIEKKYFALVFGEIKRDEAEINFPIARSKNKPGLFAAHPQSQTVDDSKKALTIFKVIKRFKNYTLLEIQILTGRTHQIRTHLLAYGYPIVGDKLYNNNRLKNKIKIPRIFLHATELKFIDLTGTIRKYASQLPAVLKGIIKKLK